MDKNEKGIASTYLNLNENLETNCLGLAGYILKVSEKHISKYSKSLTES